MYWMKTLLIIAITLSAATGWSWREGNGAPVKWREGNGGDGVQLNSKIYLLDLVESGVEEANSTDIAYSNSFFEKEVSNWAEAQMTPVPKQEIINKLGEIHRKNSIMAFVILMAMRKLDWAFINVPLKDLKDEGPYNVALQKDLIQLAIRVNKTIQIDKNSWNKMDSRNQTALIFHEAIFSLVNPNRDSSGLSMSAPRVRRIVGFLFSKKIETYSLDEMLSIEAPELRLQAFDNQEMIVSYYFLAKSELLLNAHWTIQVQTALKETTLVNEPDLRDSTAQGAERACALGTQSGSTVSLQLNADQLKLSLLSRGEQETEDFNLTNTFVHDLNVVTLQLEANLSPENCLQVINKNKRAILKQLVK